MAVTIVVMGMAQVGDVIRDATPVSMHGALASAGAAIATGAGLGLLAIKEPPFGMSVLAWRISMGAGFAVGLLMFCFFVSDAECKSTSRGGFSCRLVAYK